MAQYNNSFINNKKVTNTLLCIPQLNKNIIKNDMSTSYINKNNSIFYCAYCLKKLLCTFHHYENKKWYYVVSCDCKDAQKEKELRTEILKLTNILQHQKEELCHAIANKNAIQFISNDIIKNGIAFQRLDVSEQNELVSCVSNKIKEYMKKVLNDEVTSTINT